VTAQPLPIRKTVLVVEDHDACRAGLEFLLEQEGYAVAAAAHGQQALDQLRTYPATDLVLLDMLMPVADGWHFLAVRNRSPALASIPVVIMTTSVVSRQWALDHGCAGFVKKPVDVATLLAEVRRCLRPDA
jgi:CheY-like chemotaxis protein